MIGGVFFHSMLAYMTLEAPDWFLFDPMPGAELLDGLVWLMHRVRIPLFFMISGFLSALVVNKKGVKYFLKQRILKILLPFVLSLLVIIPIMLELYKGLHMDCGVGLCEFNWLQVYSIDSLKDISPAHLWFLYYLFIYSLVAPFIMWLKIKVNHYILIVILSILHFFMDDVMSMNKTSGFTIDVLAFSYFFMFFVWGMSSYSFARVKSKSYKTILIAFVGAITSMLAFLMSQRGFIEHSILIQILISLMTSVYAVYFILGILSWGENSFSRPSSLITYISRASYWIYLWHIIPIVFLQAILASLQWPVMLKYLVTSLGSLSILIVFYHFLARNSFIGAWLNGYKKES